HPASARDPPVIRLMGAGGYRRTVAKKTRAGSTPAVRALAAAGVEYTEHPYRHDPAAPSFGLKAAEALGRDPHQVFKTLVVSTGESLAVGIVPVSARLDLKAMAAA